MRSRLAELPIRTRIALWITAISTALLVFMAVAVYGVFAQQIMADLDQTIVLRSASYDQLLDRSTTPPVLRIEVPEVDLGTGEGVLRLYAPDGTLLQDASPSSGSSIGEQELVRSVAASQMQTLHTVDMADGDDYRVLVRPIGRGDDQVIMVSGLELSRIGGPLRLLRAILIIAVPVTAVGAGLGGYWVASRALQPVASMVQTAQRITEGDLSQRVPGADSKDELGELAVTLNAMIERIDETIQKERRFTADASHELRTPLAAIDATVDVTLGRPRTETEYRAALEQIRAQTGRLGMLTRQLLLLARLDTSNIQAGFQRIDLVLLIDAVSEPFRQATAGFTIELDIEPGRHQVNGDFELLARALLNVIENAARHAGDDVIMRIGLAAGPEFEVLTLEDNGTGMPPDLAATAFERFHRGDAAQAMPGAGLGLSIAQAIVTAHGGTIALDSATTGSGTRVRIRLPRPDMPPGE